MTIPLVEAAVKGKTKEIRHLNRVLNGWPRLFAGSARI